MGGTRRLDTQFPQHQEEHIDKSVEGDAHILFRCDEREHEVVHIGIDTSPTTLPTIHLNMMLTTVCHIHLVASHLISAKDHTRLHLPHKEAIRLRDVLRHIFLHRQVERQRAHFRVRQCHVSETFHYSL